MHTFTSSNTQMPFSLSDRHVVQQNHWAASSPRIQRHVLGGDKELTHRDTHQCMQSKPNQKLNPQVNPVHHCAKFNSPLARVNSLCFVFFLFTFGSKYILLLFLFLFFTHFVFLTPLSTLFVTSIEKVPVFLLTMAFLS